MDVSPRELALDETDWHRKHLFPLARVKMHEERTLPLLLLQQPQQVLVFLVVLLECLRALEVVFVFNAF